MEYQIRDWAIFPHGEDIIWGLHFHDKSELHADFLFDIALSSVPVKDLKPIQLTEEILVNKNNFKHDTVNGTNRYILNVPEQKCVICVILNDYEVSGKLSSILIYMEDILRYRYSGEKLYFHQLQQAIRTCDIKNIEISMWINKPY